MEKIRIGISRCLLGDKVRYDGGHKHDRYITDTLGQYFEWVPVCPEVEYGLPVPREAMRLVGNPDSPRLLTIRTGINHTEGMQKWAEDRLDGLEKEGLCGFIFKSRSPSSGMQGVKVYTESGMSNRKGVGIFARAFMNKFPLLPAEDDGRLNDPKLRENFIERIFVLKRWQEFIKKNGLPKDLVNFHAEHKLLMLAHSPKHVTILGRYAAGSKDYAGKLNQNMSSGRCRDIPEQTVERRGSSVFVAHVLPSRLNRSISKSSEAERERLKPLERNERVCEGCSDTDGGSNDKPGLNDVYFETMSEGLRLLPTAKKHTNVLHHIMGYFKKQLSIDEKQELLDIIENYHKGLIPLIVPVTLLCHYVRKYDEPYLKRQYYLNPHPLELMLRNHV